VRSQVPDHRRLGRWLGPEDPCRNHQSEIRARTHVLLKESTYLRGPFILAQSAATSRAYAAKYEEPFSEATDLAGLAAANAAAAFSGTFVVNGSPTKTQITDSAGGRSQLSQLTAAAVVLIVLVLFTGPLAYLPVAALAAVVFLIAVELVDVEGMRRILALRKHEFAVALLTTAAVLVLGVEYGIVLAIIASMVDHLRHSYSPLNSVLVKSPEGHWQPVPARPGARTEEGLVVYRFGTSLYYANASRLVEDIAALVGHGSPLRWMVIDCAAIADVDYTASAVLVKVIEHVHQHHVHLALSCVLGPVRQQLDHYGISKALGRDAYFDTPGAALEAFHSAGASGEAPRPVMPRPTMRAYMVSVPSKVWMASRDADGEYQVPHQPSLGGARGGLGRVLGLLYGLFFFIAVVGMAVGAGLGALMGKLTTTGLGSAFQDQVRDLVKPGTCALLLMLGKVTPDTAVETMSKFGGTVLKTSLSKDAGQELQEALHRGSGDTAASSR
jgi:uncharacterized membrane protein/anti-anti-sigma regulatory factor